MTDVLNTIAILSRATGKQMEMRRTRLIHVESLYASDKYVIAKLKDGQELFVDGMSVAQKTLGDEGFRHGVSLIQLKEMLDRHCPYAFRQVHRAYIVNMCEMSALRKLSAAEKAGPYLQMGPSSMELVSHAGNHYPVSRRYASQVSKLFRAGHGLAGLSGEENGIDAIQVLAQWRKQSQEIDRLIACGDYRGINAAMRELSATALLIMRKARGVAYGG